MKVNINATVDMDVAVELELLPKRKKSSTVNAALKKHFKLNDSESEQE